LETYNVVDLDVLPEAGPHEAGLHGPLVGFGWSNTVCVDFTRRLDEQPATSSQCHEAASLEWS